MISSKGTDALIALEDAAPGLLFETFPDSGDFAWPLVRWSIARAMAEVELETPDMTVGASKRRAATTFARDLLPNRYSSSHLRRSAPYLFLVSGTTLAQTPIGMHNTLVGDYTGALGREAVVLQTASFFGSDPAADRPEFVPTYSFGNAASRIELAARLTRVSAEDRAFLHRFLADVGTALGGAVSQPALARVENLMLYRRVRAVATAREDERILDRVKPRVAIMQTASYGDRSPFIRRMKERGILVVEPQHGWVGPSHGAYNYGAAMASPELFSTLPDVLLTYGDFWSSAVRSPSRKVAVGKPHLESMAARAVPLSQRKRSVLVVSSVNDPEEMTRFTVDLRNSLPADWSVQFRPHPSERQTMSARYAGLIGQDRIRIDVTPDVYESIGNSRAVIGLASTVLYEALAFGCAVFVKDSILADFYAPTEIFGPRLTDSSSVVAAVARITSATPASEATRVDVPSIWMPGGVKNFQRFLDEVAPA